MDRTSGSVNPKWYARVTGYQWLVLLIASAGWIFDAFEGQIFNITRGQLLADILKPNATDAAVKHYGDLFLAVFLVGGTFGGMLFGSLADRWGRRPMMAVSILIYSIFSGWMYFAHSLWHVGLARFLVAVGVGGEWAVAASMVAEVFPSEARAQASGIFHASSVIGIWAAALAGLAVGANWRMVYLIAVVPAVLVFWVLAKIKEPENWREAGEKSAAATGPKLGRFRDLLGDPRWRKRALLGMLLATIGLGTFWGVTVAGQDLAREFLLREGVPANVAAEKAKFAYGFVEIVGMGAGLVCMGPLCVWLGRRRAFGLMHAAAFVTVPVTCYLPHTYAQLLWALPLLGFFTGGIHSGYAVYFPELFPTHLRATGTGFCFNGGRILSALVLVFSAWLKTQTDLRTAVTMLGCLFPLGLLIIWVMPETKGQPLPE